MRRPAYGPSGGHASAVAGKVRRVAVSGAVRRDAEDHGSYQTYVRGPTTPRGAVPGAVAPVDYPAAA
ncbi:hypothetical protein, partial [Streptomyces sp. NRRL F-4428]|uniref:hypothetical protein n=1 Tax=Streptomyces sp. NRRL F-4428 TaxID=1609137 RepID=UPI001F184882